MINKAKQGQPIYERAWRILLKQGRILQDCGYKESKKKPNLFYRTIDEGRLFVDMRGTDIVPIWIDPTPLFYWDLNETLPDWKKIKIINCEMDELASSRCPCRLSFEQIDLDLNGGDGVCKVCETEFNDEGLFCSDECEAAYNELYQTRCAKCGRPIDFKTAIQHHISYNPEKVIEVCRSCHLKIHRSKKKSSLKPVATPFRSKPIEKPPGYREKKREKAEIERQHSQKIKGICPGCKGVISIKDLWDCAYRQKGVIARRPSIFCRSCHLRLEIRKKEYPSDVSISNKDSFQFFYLDENPLWGRGRAKWIPLSPIIFIKDWEKTNKER